MRRTGAVVFSVVGLLALLSAAVVGDDTDSELTPLLTEIKGLWSPLLDRVLSSREERVMKQPSPTMQQVNVVTGVHKITRPSPPAHYQGGPGPSQGVSETDLYLLGAIEKLVYRVDFMEKRLRKTEEVIYYLMADHSEKDRTDPCPANFTRAGHNCYHFSHRQYNWKSASSMCKSLGSNLAELETIEENQDVVTFIQANADFRGTDYWTGGLNPGLLWIWSNSARPVSSNSTASANANIKGSGRCLKLAFNPALRSYSYQGSDCSSRINFICEYEDNTTGRAIERIAKSLKEKKIDVDGLLARNRNS